MTDQFYKVKIDDYFLSEDGTDTPDLLCKLEASNIEDLKATVTGATFPTIGGTVRQVVPWTSGKQFEIKVSVMTSDLYETLETFLNAQNAADTSFDVIIEGDFEMLELTCKARITKPIARKDFFAGRSFETVIALETV